MEANSNELAARDTENFAPEGGSGDSQISSTSKVAISTGPVPLTQPCPSSHQPSASVDGDYQPFDQLNTFPNGYLYPDVNNWQGNSVSTGQYDDHSQQVTPSETSGNLLIDRNAYFNGNRPVQGVVDWSLGDAPPPPSPQTAPPT